MTSNRYFRDNLNPQIRPLFCGDETCDPGHDFGGYRPYLIIHIIRSGKGTFYSRGRKWDLERGDAFVIFPDEKHLYRADREEPWHYFWIAMEGNVADYFLERGVSPGSPLLTTGRVDELFSLYKGLYGEGEERLAGEDLKLCGLIYRILGDLMGNRSSVGGEPTGDMKTSHVLTMQSFINAYFRTSLTVSNVAEYARLERSYASRIFKNETGRGIAETIRGLRLEKSREFLREGLTVKEAAYSSGFRIYENFLKLFRRTYGETPSEYRRRSADPGSGGS